MWQWLIQEPLSDSACTPPKAIESGTALLAPRRAVPALAGLDAPAPRPLGAASAVPRRLPGVPDPGCRVMGRKLRE